MIMFYSQEKSYLIAKPKSLLKYAKYGKAYYHRNKHRWQEAHRARALKNKYGLTVAEYDTMLAMQGGVCRLCKRPPGKVRLAVDHDHVTGRNRGLLCSACNRRLGHVEHISPFSKIALVYIKEYE